MTRGGEHDDGGGVRSRHAHMLARPDHSGRSRRRPHPAWKSGGLAEALSGAARPACGRADTHDAGFEGARAKGHARGASACRAAPWVPSRHPPRRARAFPGLGRLDRVDATEMRF